MSEYNHSSHSSPSSPSSSPSPSSVQETDFTAGLSIQYQTVDPTFFLDNPKNQFGSTFRDCPVDEKLGSLFVDLLLSYQSLSNSNINIAIQNIKNILSDGRLTNSDIYELLDKFFINVPDVGKIDSSFITFENLPLFISKHELHLQISEKLKKMNEILQRLQIVEEKNFSDGNECNNNVCGKNRGFDDSTTLKECLNIVVGKTNNINPNPTNDPEIFVESENEECQVKKLKKKGKEKKTIKKMNK